MGVRANPSASMPARREGWEPCPLCSADKKLGVPLCLSCTRQGKRHPDAPRFSYGRKGQLSRSRPPASRTPGFMAGPNPMPPPSEQARVKRNRRI